MPRHPVKNLIRHESISANTAPISTKNTANQFKRWAAVFAEKNDPPILALDFIYLTNTSYFRL